MLVPLRTGNISTAQIGNSSDTGLSHCLRRVTLDADGNMRMYSWVVGNSTKWDMVWELFSDVCKVFGRCGPFGICREEGQCTCAEGFHFINANDTSQGCARTNDITLCTKVDQSMVLLESVDFPGSGDYATLYASNASVCVNQCLSSCFCGGFSMTSSIMSNGYYHCYFKKGAIYNGHFTGARISYLRIGIDTGPNYRFALLQQRFAVLVEAASSTIAFLGALSTVLLCVVGVRFIRHSIRRRHTRRLEEKWRVSRGTLVPFTYKEIRFMTRNFADEIGRGGYGSVFKGHIGDMVVVAVKRLDNISPQETEFMNEVDSIGYIHHVNLVDLQGYCVKENREKLLVYEYMERGSLDRVLFRASDSKSTANSSANKSPVLEWRSRFRIAVDIAKGLEYLHTNVRGRCIVHCDIKPENILLDSMLSAKVGDFGLVRTMSKEQTHTITRHIRGTCGYLAPEWASEHTPITAKTDVYSYGMVLLEIVSGRRNLKSAVDADSQPDWYFPQWAFPKVEAGEFLQVVDPLLTGIVDATEVERVLQVAFWCINDKPLVRPSMTEVVGFLEGQIPIELPVPRPLLLDDILGSLQDDDEQRHHFGSLLTTSESLEASGQVSHPPPYAIEISPSKPC